VCMYVCVGGGEKGVFTHRVISLGHTLYHVLIAQSSRPHGPLDPTQCISTTFSATHTMCTAFSHQIVHMHAKDKDGHLAHEMFHQENFRAYHSHQKLATSPEVGYKLSLRQP